MPSATQQPAPRPAPPQLPVALTLAGSDSGAGAGIQADLLAFAANDVYGATAITCLTAQNPDGVSAVIPLPPSFVLEQARQVARYFTLDALKTGMLLNREIIAATATFIREQRGRNPRIPLVLDPVMVATSGARLLDPDAVASLLGELFPLATLLTPNLDEAATLLGKPAATTATEMFADARALRKKFGADILLKGGHLPSSHLRDILVARNGAEHVFHAQRHPDANTHGSGCTLAAAIAAQLAHRKPLPDAVAAAHAYLQAGMHSPIGAGGHGFIAHFP
ncbi:MAG: bifunctional hydroxymethylpyrimidine kinase/phosphomethylpyrimidine kinase [Puniceicoccales bacterium]|jgi:hydroxymethylpyrimidine/phosphomethylpyrimidine kinase|nr:bifunctional hydroxymethylpyrimidine kinase/phosphomethylpyrimidine kinase [Puniceicoccales bacterium]